MKKISLLLMIAFALLLGVDSSARRKLKNPGGTGTGGTPGNCATIGNTLYVDASASISGDGTRTRPFQKLEEALGFANNCEYITAIRVAGGVYKSTAGIGRQKTFFIGGNYTITGGYAPGSNFWGVSNPGLYPTILDGDNNLHTLVIAHDVGKVNIRGIQVRNGKADDAGSDEVADGVSLFNNAGAGVYIVSPELDVSFTNNVIWNNYASGLGGGFFINGSDEINFSLLIVSPAVQPLHSILHPF